METNELTIKRLQAYIREGDHRPEFKEKYFFKLIEEIGELSEALNKDRRMEDGGGIKGTVEEELADVLYYIAAIANICEIDLETSFRMKDEINREKYKREGPGINE